MEQDLVTTALQNSKSSLDQVSPSFCLAKWLQVTLHLHNGNTQSCHHVKAHRIDLAESEIHPDALHNTQAKMETRAKMLNGERPKECSYCWKAEDQGRVSDRVIKSSEDWAEPFSKNVIASGVGKHISPTYLEVAFDSVCNFRCMYCSPSFSTSWMEEIKQYGSYPTSVKFNSLPILKLNRAYPLEANERERYIQSFWKWWPDVVNKLEHFRITGGEPFLAAETFRTLEYLIENPQPRLKMAVNTNMGMGPNKLERVIGLINNLEGRVQEFSLFTSLDSTGAQAEYIRFGLDYGRFCKNTEEILTRVKWPIVFAYMITVNALSVAGLKDLLALIVDQRRRYPQHNVTFDTPFLNHPEHMSVEILTPDFAKYIEAARDFMVANKTTASQIGFSETEIVKVDRIRSLIEKPSHKWLNRVRLRRDFVKMFTEYDRRRKTDFHATFPEYQKFWRVCQLSSMGL